MPHVKLQRPKDLKGIWKDPPRFSHTISEKDISFNFNNCYISGDEREVLFRWAVAEGRLVQHILFSLRLEEGFMIMGVAKNYPVLRTEGVKLLMAILACALEEAGCELISSSLQPYMKDGRFYWLHIPKPGPAGEYS